MKKIQLLITALLIGTLVQAQGDLSVHYKNYENGELLLSDTIKTHFVIVNESGMIHPGDSIYVSAKINGTFYGLTLIGTSTAIIAEDHLMSGDSLEFDPGVILGPSTMIFFPGDTALEFCIVVWGIGINAVDLTPAFPGDSNPEDNTTCVTFDPDWETLSIQNVNDGQVKIYPNPASDYLIYDSKNNMIKTINIYNLNGAIVKSSNVNAMTGLIDIADLQTGLYGYSITFENNSKSTGVINKQ
jgi:hypothetical protein